MKETIEDGGLIYMAYEVSFNRFGFLSFSISIQGCGAHCSTTDSYFNFDLATGKSVAIEDVIEPGKIDSFRIMVQADKINALTTYKTGRKGEYLK